MATTRRADGIRRHRYQFATTSTRSHSKNLNHNRNSVIPTVSTRTKRYPPPPDHEIEPFKNKKRKITVEIPSNPPIQRTEPSRASTQAVRSQNDRRRQRSPAHAPTWPEDSEVAANQTASIKHQSRQSSTVGPALPQPRNAAEQPPKPKGKAPALKHELKCLDPRQRTKEVLQQNGRKLRSQEATRFKSELSAYFPDYDEVIGNDPKEQHILNLDTPIVVIDSHQPPIHPGPPTTLDSGAQNGRIDTGQAAQGQYPVRSYPDDLFTELFDTQRIDLSFLETRSKDKALQDPLPDTLFEPSHKKAERLERSIRNLEKGRAQHEKDQIVRLLDGLQGHDWLRVMGVSGITESKKKTFEPAREHFIKGCQAILRKFRKWAAEEKRRKLEKDRALAEAEVEAERVVEGEPDREQEQEEDEEEEEDEGEEEEQEGSTDEKVSEDGQGSGRSNGEEERSRSTSAGGDQNSIPDSDVSPNYSDVDAYIAKQLREEAMAAAKINARKVNPVQAPPQDFTSFFQKRYQRDAALSKGRRRGRTVLAWGHPVPEVAEGDFELPCELRDCDTLRSQARRRRKDRRGRR
ncbi:hypothetical protein VTK73DRAFT_7684 [Phialemonium thermophilum]|uniref:Something about silencing protein 4 domain-containing protein n=1 Tax=Phialemonium thermophilum TaxID=223376 RepID=A0ABR3XRH9_9PEZI